MNFVVNKTTFKDNLTSNSSVADIYYSKDQIISTIVIILLIALDVYIFFSLFVYGRQIKVRRRLKRRASLNEVSNHHFMDSTHFKM